MGMLQGGAGVRESLRILNISSFHVSGYPRSRSIKYRCWRENSQRKKAVTHTGFHDWLMLCPMAPGVTALLIPKWKRHSNPSFDHVAPLSRVPPVWMRECGVG